MDKKINIIGSGLMSAQISALFYNLGYEINIYFNKNKNEKNIKLNTILQRKIFNLNSLDGKIIFYDNIDLIKNYFTIETVAENISVKKSIFDNLIKKRIENIFSNTSSIDIKKINKKIDLLHFMNPINIKSAEYTEEYKGKFVKTNIYKDLVNLNFNFLELKNTESIGINRIIFAEISEFFKIYENENINIIDLNKTYSRIKNVDIINLVDKIGIDVCLAILKNLNKFNNNYYVPKIFKFAIENNILGRKNKTSIKKLINEKK